MQKKYVDFMMILNLDNFNIILMKLLGVKNIKKLLY